MWSGLSLQTPPLLKRVDMPVTSEQILETVMSERQKLHAYAWIVVGDPTSAEDVVQEACLKATQHADKINDPDHLRAWLREAIRRRGMAVRRKRMTQASQLSLEALSLLAQVSVDLSNDDYKRRMEALRHCMDLLGDKTRDTLALRYGKGMKPAKIAEKTGRPLQSVYKMITRSHASLRDCILNRLSQKEDA